MLLCGLGTILVVSMMNSTSWMTISTTSTEEIGAVDIYSKTDMGFGLNEFTIDSSNQFCFEDEPCESSVLSNTDSLLNIDLVLFGEDADIIDCTTPDKDQKIICETEAAGSTGHLLILGGVITLALTLVLACIGIFGYIPGWVLRLIGVLSATLILVGAITWFVMMPDLNDGLGADDDKWHLSHGFFLTLIGPPLIFFGGFILGNMESYALEYDDDDWEDEEDDYQQSQEGYTPFTNTMIQSDYSENNQHEIPDVNWQGVWGDDGFEWIEYPEGSDTWYWRDQETGQWFLHQK